MTKIHTFILTQRSKKCKAVGRLANRPLPQLPKCPGGLWFPLRSRRKLEWVFSQLSPLLNMPPNEPPLSPEVGLLDRLVESDLALPTAMTLFPRVDRAKKAVEACVRSQTVELVCKRDGEEMVIQPWRLRFVLNDPGTWDCDPLTPVYHLRLTADAHDRYLADGHRFVKELFER